MQFISLNVITSRFHGRDMHSYVPTSLILSEKELAYGTSMIRISFFSFFLSISMFRLSIMSVLPTVKVDKDKAIPVTDCEAR
jgi:hypothetical protein